MSLVVAVVGGGRDAEENKSDTSISKLSSGWLTTLDGDVPWASGVYAASHIPGAQHSWMVNDGHLDFWLSPDAAQAQQVVIAFFATARVWRIGDVDEKKR